MTCLALLSILGSVKLWPWSKTATVYVYIVDGLTADPDVGQIKSFKNKQTGHDLAKNFRMDHHQQVKARGVAYGHYDLKLDQPGFPEAERPVDVFQPEVDLYVDVRIATVHIVPLYLSGEPMDLEAHVKSFKGDEYGLDLASSFKTNTAKKVPYGVYDLLVEERGFASFKEQVDVFQPEMWVLAALQVGREGSASTQTLSGIVKNLDPKEEPIYVRVVSVFPNGVDSPAIDSKLDITGNSGTFNLIGIFSSSEYALATIGHSGILDFRKIVASDFFQKPIVIDLGKKSRSASGEESPN